MSGVEIVGIIAATAAVITAFDNGGAIVKRLNQKRKKPLPSQLEEKVTQAPLEIAKETKRGLERFGGKFDSGDPDTIILFQSIIINLQNSFLERLRHASNGDEVDFSALVDNVDLVRSQTVGALNGLYQKLLQGGDTIERPSLASPSSPVSPATVQPASRVQTLASSSKETIESENSSVITSKDVPSKAPRRTSMFRIPYHSPKASRDRKPQSDDAQSMKPIGKFVSLAPQQPKRSSTGYNAISHPGVTDQHAHRNHQDRAQHGEDTSQAMRPRSQRRETCPSLLETSTIATTSSGSSNAASMTRSASNDTSGVPEMTDVFSASKPTAENNFHGLCRGAVKIQHGKRDAMVSGVDAQFMSGKVPLLSCEIGFCQFKGHKPSEIIWNNVLTDRVRGIKYRWALLAKSHVKQSFRADRQYLYTCIFCVYMGYKSPIFQEDEYLDHICQVHRGTIMNNVVLYNTSCISSHICHDGEDFDINLFPLTPQEQNDRRLIDLQVSTAAPEALMDVDAYLKSFTNLKV